ncbi:DUF2213 domain-containing protein [Rhizobium leguminosarum]|uniref:DUF2213 domain-containing protein n=1 Tax=Rhizobium leguminosarum TaxID=384 RepID=UPI001030EF33|nr:DUF2213 domain-containing protein [Rhizobium leguminosarum]TAV89306.1 DUF2213 domain-containing protein [Rhizobium leguminosarum]TAV93887.1 DUF2213 domain-containing protein [Rhizobium leguminosarum]TAW34964.1 DUF2213 domain-containing protein [Rhizobium leguminosarum]
MQFTDKLTLDGAIRRTADGYGVVSAKVARGGNVQLYLGSEVGMNDKATVRVYRPESEVFKKDAIASYAGVPVTINHPKNGVSADTWKDLAVGEVGDDVLRDGEFVRVPMMLRDAKAIKAVEDGKRELSMGYSAEITIADGVTPSGETFDAIMSDFKMNHVAIVDQARGGAELRIGDGADKWGAAPISTTDKETVTMTDALRTVVVDGLSVQTTDQGAQAIAKLLKDLESSAAKIVSSDAAHATAIATKDEEIGTLKAENQKLKDAAPKPADLDKLVADRAALVTTIKAIDSKIEVSGISDNDLRRAAVKAKLGDEMVKDASDAEITGMFKAIAKDVKTADPFARVVSEGLHNVGDAATKAEDAWGKSIDDLNAWRKEA